MQPTAFHAVMFLSEIETGWIIEQKRKLSLFAGFMGTSRHRPKWAQMTLFLNFNHFLSAEKYPKGYAWDSKTHFPHLEIQKSTFQKKLFSSEKSHSAEKRTFSSMNYFLSS